MGFHGGDQTRIVYWNVSTRPKDKNGLGLTIPEVLAEVENIENLLMLLPDTPAVYAEWKRIIWSVK